MRERLSDTEADLLRLAERGQMAAVEPVCRAETTPPGWRWALSMELTLSSPTGDDSIELPKRTDFPQTNRAPGIGFGIASAGLHALALGQVQALREWSRLAAGLEPATDTDRLAMQMPQRWLDALKGAPDSSLQEAERAAQQASCARLVIELRVARALAAEMRGVLESALYHARRASIMAQAEGMPQREYLANMVLARQRRLSGSPFLAARILTGLARVVSPAWRGWLDWESLLAGRRERLSPERAGDDRAGWGRHTSDIRRLLNEIGLTDRGGSRGRWDSLTARASSLRPCLDDLVVLRSALEGDEAGRRHPEIEPWLSGATDLIPSRLAGLLTSSATVDQPVAWVLAGVPSPRRVPALLLDAQLDPPQLEASRMRSGREESLAACLALTPMGLEPQRLFERVYGFDYVQVMHEGTLRVALHRTRERLQGLATIRRHAGQIVLVPSQPFLIPDPRCARHTLDHLLFAIASRPGRARELAARLSISLRTVQRYLNELVEEGVCVARKDGRAVVYAVEDTTFSEPTRAH